MLTFLIFSHGELFWAHERLCTPLIFLSWNMAPVDTASFAICLLVTAGARCQEPGISAALADHESRGFLAAWFPGGSTLALLIHRLVLGWNEQCYVKTFCRDQKPYESTRSSPLKWPGLCSFTQWLLLSKDILTYFSVHRGLISFKRKKHTTTL